MFLKKRFFLEESKGAVGSGGGGGGGEKDERDIFVGRVACPKFAMMCQKNQEEQTRDNPSS